jgi:hypothetical protein
VTCKYFGLEFAQKKSILSPKCRMESYYRKRWWILENIAGRIDSTLSDGNVNNIILNFENFSTIQFKMYYFLISILRI